MKKYITFFLILICTATTASAYTRIVSRGGNSPRWASMPISYWINDLGSPQISNGSEFNAVHAAFRAWQNVSSADVSFNFRGMTPVRNSAQDGMNLVSFADDSIPLGSSTIAVTLSWFGTDINGGSIVQESDIVFNNALQFSTSGELDKFDIQGVLTHEVGHLLGLDHSGIISAVMVPFAAVSQTDQRTLTYDDIAGISEIYPRAAFISVGQIRGTVRLNGNAIFGAHVVAVDSSGTALVSTLSQPDGSYVLRFLPPGNYRLYAEPLDRPVLEAHVGGGSNSWYRNLRTDFGTTYYGNAVTLSEARTIEVAAGTIPTADINVAARSATNLNLTNPGFAPRVGRGSNFLLRVGGEDITAGLAISTSSPSMILSTPTFGGRISTSAPTSATMDLTIQSSTSLGPKNIAVNRGPDVALVSGVIVVTDPPPSNLMISPASAPSEGGASVTITGNDFRSGAQVLFGGVPAQNVQVIDSGTILTTAPRNVPGSMNLQVFNADGTSGILRNGFSYFSPPPTITRVSPLTGPPTTTVTIEGTQFDSRTQNVEVRFNGVLARVVSSTSTSIQTIVPFGATSGGVTVSVFGQTATGPTFTVTAATASSNVARNSYNFVDASSAAGGTSLSFNSADDAIAFVNLPFTFSLFRDIYLEGSRISVSTNGWLSMETISAPEFQNASLPAQTVTRPGGSSGTVPPALIAPYWDDLILKSGISSVSTRTVGTAPNRQFIIQWTKMSILDEVGADLNSSVTFQAVLYEGSNDIQYVYESMTGSRSDGSSATVGAQDKNRATAIQTSFDQAGSIRSNQFITYRFTDGTYSASVGTPDLTPPTRPVVTDAGVATSNRTELSASWVSSDPESGIREYWYAIGRTPGGTEVRPFTSTTQSSIVATGLNLDVGVTYYFAVRALNTAGLMSELGVSDGIRVDAAVQTFTKVIPASSHSSVEYGGIALLAPAAMSVTFRAYEANGNLLSGSGIRNPVTINMTAGQQYARLISDLFGLATFDGWIEIESSSVGLGVYSATGSWNLDYLDGSVAGELLTDFMLYHSGGYAVIVNPSTRAANVTIGSQSIVIPARTRTLLPIPAPVRVRSSEGLAVIERVTSFGKLGISAPGSVSGASASLVFVHAVVGAGYTSTARITNVSTSMKVATITFAGVSADVQIEANTTVQVSLAQLLGLAGDAMRTGSVQVRQQATPVGSTTPSLIGILDIENSSGLATINTQTASTNISFSHVAHGGGLFTGLAFATGDRAATITVEVYGVNGGTPQTGTISLGPNQQVARVISAFVPSVTYQLGGYIRIRSDQPIWAWEIYGSDNLMASAPPLP